MTKRIRVDITLSDLAAEYLQKICELEGVSRREWLAREIKKLIAGVAEFHAVHSGLEVPNPGTIGRRIQRSRR